MKKFSKVLCLVLVLAMMAGLCCFGTSAAFADADKITYKEAVDVLAATEVLVGDAQGFRPTDGLTRAEACVMIAKLCDAADLGTTTSFKDVKGHWGEKYISYCAAEGYVSGYSKTAFGPNDALTGYAWGLMLLRVLGYIPANEGIAGDTWEIGVAKLMKKIELNKGIENFDGTKAITREQAAQLALNALKSTCVEYKDAGTTITAGNVTIVTGADAATKVAAGGYNYNDATEGDDLAYQQLAEKLYGNKLKFAANTAAGTDAFGRPANKWTYKDKEVGTYTDTPVATFTAKTKAADVATALNGYKIKNAGGTALKIENTTSYSTSFNTNSVVVKNGAGASAWTIGSEKETLAKAIADETANGTLIEFYANKDKVITKVVAIEYTNDQVKKVTTDKKTGDVTYKFTVATGDFIDHADADVVDNIKFDTAPAKDDYVTVVYCNSNSALYVYPTTKVEGAISYANNTTKKLTLDGTTYEANAKMGSTSFGLTEKTATIYVDQYGFVSAYKGPESTGDKSVIITNVYQALEDGKLVNMYDGITSNGETVTAKYETVTDGESVPTNTLTPGHVYKYADADDDAKNELTVIATSSANTDAANVINDAVLYVGTASDVTASTKKLTVATGMYAYFTSDVNFIFVNAEGKSSVATGAQKVTNGSKLVAVIKYKATPDGDGVYYIDTLYILNAAAAISTTSDDIVFVLENSAPASTYISVDGKNKTYYEYSAYINGEKVEDFYSATTSLANSTFYNKEVETASGAYVFGTATATSGEGTIVVANKDFNAKINAANIGTVDTKDYDFTDATIVDTRKDGDIDSIEALNDNVSSGLKVSMVFNGKTSVVEYVYVTE